ncbi:hypothetical protein GCM10023085_35980 [Actinomadura viridis]|uniref:Uncharacterized protein n=1 Tax=Actinomadura viridis TaxID=58110 RepID=A0A931DD17_9ACTN|nr:hypothetical protein [Actinomadura viridis]MBG6087865.1 hypothetical protein [Actinomadura viridis]
MLIVEDLDRAKNLHYAIRVIAILKACREVGISPVPLASLHAIAYFSDALAPTWKVRVLESQVLKQEDFPLNPRLQRNIDGLVGAAIIKPSKVSHHRAPKGWRLDAQYELNSVFSKAIIEAMEVDAEFHREMVLTREVTLALAGMRAYGLAGAVLADAAYSDPLLDFGNIVDLQPEEEGISRTKMMADRFVSLMASQRALTPAETTHLYVRHLFSVMRKASSESN